MACMLCGVKTTDGDVHEDSEQHQLAGARLAIETADGMGFCPYCDYDHKKRRSPRLALCSNTDHAAKLAYCRQLLAEQPEEEEA